MKPAQFGTTVAVIGYALAIYGAWLLYKNVPPDRPFGTIPRTNDIVAFQAEQQRQIQERASGSRRGFLLLMVGSILQLAGTAVAGLRLTLRR